MLQKLRERNEEGLALSESKGFTIIEVLIVLAIAGLIMLIVFLAVPALQRNSRNTSRKSDASHLASAVGDWVNNNGGQLPVATNTQTIFTDAGGKTGLSQLGDLVMDTTGTPTPGDFSIVATASVPTIISAPGATVDKDTVELLVPPASSPTNGWVCNGATPSYTGTPRNSVLMYTVESGTTPWTWDCLTAQ